jgi:hypothetical protein
MLKLCLREGFFGEMGTKGRELDTVTTFMYLLLRPGQDLVCHKPKKKETLTSTKEKLFLRTLLSSSAPISKPKPA